MIRSNHALRLLGAAVIAALPSLAQRPEPTRPAAARTQDPDARTQDPDARQQDPAAAQTLASGPQQGATVRPIPAVVVGEGGGAEIDAAAGFAEGPGVILFVHEITREVAPVIRAVDELGVAYAGRALSTSIVRVADDRTEAETRMPMVSRSLRLRRPIVVSVDGADGPGDYALTRRATLTVVVTKDGVVHRAFGLTDTGQKDVPMLESLVAEVAGPRPDPATEPLPTDVQALQQLIRALQRDNAMLRNELEALRGRMRQNRGGMRGQPDRGADAAPRRGDGDRDAVPSPDRSIGGQVRLLARKDATDAQIESALERVSARIEATPEDKAQTCSMLQRILDQEFSTESGRKLIREWLAAQDGE